MGFHLLMSNPQKKRFNERVVKVKKCQNFLFSLRKKGYDNGNYIISLYNVHTYIVKKIFQHLLLQGFQGFAGYPAFLISSRIPDIKLSIQICYRLTYVQTAIHMDAWTDIQTYGPTLIVLQLKFCVKTFFSTAISVYLEQVGYTHDVIFLATLTLLYLKFHLFSIMLFIELIILSFLFFYFLSKDDNWRYPSY